MTKDKYNHDGVDPDEETPLTPATSPGSADHPHHNHIINNNSNKPLSWTLLVTVLVVTLGSSLQFGYGTGVMNNSRIFIMDYFTEKQNKEYTLLEWSTVVSAYGVGGLMGSVLGPKVIGRYTGRRGTLLLNNIFLFFSSYMMAYAQFWWWQVVGRISIGIVAGIATAVVPTYLAEISPLHVRGGVSTIHQLAITVGILISQCLSTPSLHLFGSVEHWQWLFFVPALCGVVQILVLPFCPESPSYLYLQGDRPAARRAIVRFQSEHVADEYLGYIEEESKGSGQSSMTVYELFAERSLRKQLVVGVVVQLMMQFSGIDACFYYSTMVFRQANVADPELATTLLGVINVIITIFAVKYMDSAGRKTLLRYSWMGMCTSYVVLSTSFIAKPYLAYMDQVSVISMTGVIVFFAFGPGCIAWFIIAEIFPISARDSAMTIGIFINWVANWLVAFSFPILLQFTQPFTFFIFVATTAYFLYFTNNFVPETKGLTVAQVIATFDHIHLNV